MNHEKQVDKMQQYADIKNSLSELADEYLSLRNMLIKKNTCS